MVWGWLRKIILSHFSIKFNAYSQKHPLSNTGSKHENWQNTQFWTNFSTCMGLRHWIQSEPLPSSRWKSSWSPGTAPTRLVGMDLVIIIHGHRGHCNDRHLYCGHHDHRDNQGYYYPIHDNIYERSGKILKFRYIQPSERTKGSSEKRWFGSVGGKFPRKISLLLVQRKKRLMQQYGAIWCNNIQRNTM